MSASQDHDELKTHGVVAATKEWLEKAVIGLDLCPFARAVYRGDWIRYVVCPAEDPEALLSRFIEELHLLISSAPEEIETTLLIHPRLLSDFLEYNEFLGVADAVLEDLGLSSTVQVASFHPGYRFANSEPDSIDNYTNRSPYPMLHLLRQASVDRAVTAFPDPAKIYEKNIATLRLLGHEGWQRLGIATGEGGRRR